MSHMSDLLTKWSHQMVTISGATTAWDDYGQPVLSASTTATVLIQYTIRNVTDAQGAQKVSTCQILFPPDSSVAIGDKITLPDGQQPLILSIEKTVDFDGNLEYVKIYT